MLLAKTAPPVDAATLPTKSTESSVVCGTPAMSAPAKLPYAFRKVRP